MECVDDFNDVCSKRFVVSSIKDLFENVQAQNIIDFIKETRFCHAMLSISAAYAVMWCV